MKSKTNISVLDNRGIRVNPSVIIGNTGNGYVSGDILDANAVQEKIDKVIGLAPEDLDTIAEAAQAIITMEDDIENIQETIDGFDDVYAPKAENGYIENPDNAGINGQILSINSQGNTTWINPTEGSVLDNSMSDISENPVQNKIIKEYVDSLIYDISVLHPTSGVSGGNTYASLSDALAVIPQDKHKGGVTVRYIQSSDNKYVQYRLMKNTWSTTVANWQGVDDLPTVGSENLVESGGAFAKVIKLTGMGSNTDQYHVTKVGDCFYHTTNKKIYRCTIFPITIFVNCVAEVPFVDGAVYIYENVLYVWNGSDLVPAEDKKAFNGIVTTQDLDTLFDSGTYKYESGVIVIVTKYSNTDIRQIRIGSFSSGTIKIEYRKYNGTSWSDWEVFLDGQTNTKAIEACQKTIELKCFATSLADAGSKGATVGDYFFNTTLKQIVLIMAGGIVETIPFINGAIYTYNNILYKWDSVNEELVAVTFKERIGALYYVDVDLSKCNILPKALDGSNNWINGTMYIIPVKTSRIKIKANAVSNNSLLFLKYIPDTSINFDTSSFATGYDHRVGVTANTEEEFNLPSDCNYVCVNRTTSSNSGNAPQSFKVDVDAIQDYLREETLSESVYSQGMKQNVGSAIVIKNPSDLVPINDTFTQRAASDCRWCIDSVNGIAYAIYMCGTNSYYETTGKIGVTVFSLSQPWRQDYYIVAQTGDLDENGVSIGTTFIGNVCLIDSNTVRFFIGNTSGQYYYYRDFNVTAKTFGAIKRMQFNNVDLTRDNIVSQIVAAGYSVPNRTSINVRGRLNIPAVEGYRYALFDIYEGISYQAIMRSNDNWASAEFVGVLPYEVQYEACLAYNGTAWYIMYRTEGGQMLTTTTDFVTFTEPVQVSDLSAKPDIFYNNNIYLVSGYSDGPDGTFKRTNLQVLRGAGINIASYTKVLEIYDKKGVVYPMIHQFAKGQYYMCCYETSPISLDEENGSINQRYRGKNCVVFKKIRIV